MSIIKNKLVQMKGLSFLVILLLMAQFIHAQTANLLTAKEKKQGWVLLFDGKTTNGWTTSGGKPVPAGWEVKDGSITTVKDGKGGDIVTVGEYKDFDFSADYNIVPGCNSGIKYFYTKYAQGGNLGMEYQILDDKLAEDNKKENHLCGSFYDALPPNAAEKKVNEPGQWNTIRIVAKGENVEHWLNNKKILEFTRGSKSYTEAVATSKFNKTEPAHSKWSAYCSIYFTDEDADGRQQGSYVLRVSGKVDGVRLPKSLFYVSRVMQNEKPDIQIIGHWNYPADTKKTLYVAANHCDKVELFLNGKSLGVATKPILFVDTFNGRLPGSELQGDGTGYVYAFPDIKFFPGSLKAIATRNGKIVAQQELQTAGEPKAIKLTLYTGPKGLQADGSDVALIDFEVVDAQGRRCPTDEERVDFTVSGPVIWRGGFNAAKLNTTNNLYLDTECGINRVSVRSTLIPGKITITASRKGLTSAILKIETKRVEITGGLMPDMPQTMPGQRSIERK